MKQQKKTKDLQELKNQITELELVKARIKAMKGRQEELETLIKTAMGEAELGFADGFQVKYTIGSRNSFDSGAFKEENPELYKKYCTEVETRRFSVKALKSNKEVSGFNPL